MKSLKKLLISLVVMVAVVLFFMLVDRFWVNNSTYPSTAAALEALNGKILKIKAPGGNIRAEVASDQSSMERGLGGRDSMPEDYSMIFSFSDTERAGFWMKDMHFPLDFVWIDSSHNVIGVTTNIATSTYPGLIFPPGPINFVMELNAGAAEKFGIGTSTILKF